MNLSIIICTAGDRAELKNCLESLASCKGVELLVVNNSNKKLSVDKRFIVVNEKIPGLSVARNTGWKNAKGKFVVYIDDDSIADKDWISEILSFIKKHPKAQVFGGPYDRHSYVKIPKWLPEDYGSMKNGNKVKKLIPRVEWLSGTNMVYKRELLKKLNGFKIDFGMSGKSMGYGEETELQQRIHEEKINIWYNPRQVVSHLIDKRKLNIFWQIKDSFIRGRDLQRIKFGKLSEDTKKKYKAKKQTKSQKFVGYLKKISYIAGSVFGGKHDH